MEERSDAVRVMTIHKAKGLDFPIAIVASLGLKRQSRPGKMLADFHNQKAFGLRIGLKDSGLRTPGWEELSEEEKKREDAELVRLLYVALTRARDHLIISTHTQKREELEPGGRWIPNMESTRLEPLIPFLKPCFSEESDLVRWVDMAELDAESVPCRAASTRGGKDWRAIAEREYQELRALFRATPSSDNLKAAGEVSGMAEAAERAEEDRTPENAESRAVRLGTAYHEAMERVSFFSLDGLTPCVQASGVRHRLDPEALQELDRMVRTTLDSALLDRARAALQCGKRVLREIPFVRPVSGPAIEEGKIDLLIEETEGWVLVDYKTDRVQSEPAGAVGFFRDKYAGQIREYLAALQDLSVKVHSAYLLLARTGQAISVIRDSRFEIRD
jgi:ATP-dependent exoDNAse (exonuclease V) beta subunit